MSDGVKEATLNLVSGDDFLDNMIRKVLRAEYPSLSGARIEVFWALARPSSWWGNLKIASEEVWLISEGVDIILQLNHDLWKGLDAAGREGLLSHFFWIAEAKTSGDTVQRTSEGERQLYKRRKPSMAVAAEVIARHPALCDQLPELKSFRKAIKDPQQFLLDLQEPEEEMAA